jgi:large subunit ribosomal protein L17
MRHRKAGKELGRNSSHRRAMLRNLVTSLFEHEQIEIAEKMITLAKRGDLHARRQALGYIRDKAVTHRLFEDIKERYLDRQGGYTRTIKKCTRRGDGAPISIVQLVASGEGEKSGKRRGKAESSKKKGQAKAKKQKKKTKVAQKQEGKSAETAS